MTLNFWPHPWHWLGILKVKFWKSCISGMGGSIYMEQKRCESIGCWTRYVTMSYDLDLGFSRSSIKKLYPWSGMAEWHEKKGCEVIGSQINFELCPWPWPWILWYKFWKSCTSGMGVSIDMEQKGYESIRCLTHYMILSYDLDLRFSRSNLKKSCISGMVVSDHDFNNLTLPSPATDYKHVRMNEEMNEWVWKRWKCEWMKERMNEQVTNKGN